MTTSNELLTLIGNYNATMTKLQQAVHDGLPVGHLGGIAMSLIFWSDQIQLQTKLEDAQARCEHTVIATLRGGFTTCDQCGKVWETDGELLRKEVLGKAVQINPIKEVQRPVKASIGKATSAAKPTKGHCTVCGKLLTLTTKGKVRLHKSEVWSERQSSRVSRTCLGSRHIPKESNET